MVRYVIKNVASTTREKYELFLSKRSVTTLDSRVFVLCKHFLECACQNAIFSTFQKVRGSIPYSAFSTRLLLPRDSIKPNYIIEFPNTVQVQYVMYVRVQYLWVFYLLRIMIMALVRTLVFKHSSLSLDFHGKTWK